MANVLSIYAGKEMVKVDIDNLLSTSVEVLDRIQYANAKKYGDFIAAIEITVEDCTGNATNITDEVTYKLAIADLVNIINNDKEETVMEAVVTNVTVVETTNNETEETIMNETTLKERIMDVAGNIKVENVVELLTEAGEELAGIANDTVEDVAPHVEKVKTYLVTFSSIIGIIGLPQLKNNIDKVIYSLLDGDCNPTQIRVAVNTITKLCKEEIKRLNYFSTNKTIAQSLSLKAMVGDAYTDKNIFEAAFAALLNVIKRAVKFIQDKYALMESKAKSIVVKAILKGIRSIFGALIQGGVAIIKFAGHAVSFVIAGVTAIGYWAFNTIKKLCAKLATWVKGKFNKEEDFEEDDFFEEDDVELTVEA